MLLGFFFKRSVFKSQVLVFIFTSLIYNLCYISPSVPSSNHYSGVFFWKVTALLNHPQLNFFILICLTYLCTLNKLKKPSGLFWPTIAAILYTQYYHLPTYSIYTRVSSFFVFKKYNVALLNGFVNLHPWGIFLTYCLFVILVCALLSRCRNWAQLVSRKFVNQGLYNFGQFVSVWAIFLGSYWAFQELSWGGWWNWDIVELLSLNFFMLAALGVHSTLTAYHVGIIKYWRMVFKIFLAFTASVIVVRLNMLSSVHAFVSADSAKLVFLKLTILAIFITLSFFFLVRGLWRSVQPAVGLRKYLSPVVYANLNYTLILTIVLAGLIFFLMFNEPFLNFTTTVTLLMGLLLVYFNVFFTKFKAAHIFRILTPMFGSLTLLAPQPGPRVKAATQHASLRNLTNTFHFTLIAAFWLIFFLKIYFAGITNTSILVPTAPIQLAPVSSVCYTNRFVLVEGILGWSAPMSLPNYQIYYSYDFFVINLNKEFLFQYYKNQFHCVLGFFIKQLTTNAGAVFLSYTPLFYTIVAVLGFYVVLLRLYKYRPVVVHLA